MQRSSINSPVSSRRRRSRLHAPVFVLSLTLGTLQTSAQDTLVPPPGAKAAAASTPTTEAPETATPPSAPAANADRRPRPLGAARTASNQSREATPGSAEPRQTASSSTGTLVQSLASLGMVLGLILALGAGLKRLMRSRGGIAGALGAMGASPSPAGILEVLGRYPLSRGTSLVLLKVDRRVLLLAQNSGGLRVRGGAPLPTALCEITDPEDVASIMIKANEADGRSIGATFRQALAGFERQHDGVIEARSTGLLGRFIRRGSGGDRAELLDESALGGEGDPLRLQAFERRAADPVGSLRSRLSELRGGGAA